MIDAPAFDFFPERWTHGTRHFSKVERCDYLDLLCAQWTGDGLPADVELIARILGYRQARQVPPLVLEKFPVAEDGKRRNPRLEQLPQGAAGADREIAREISAHECEALGKENARLR